MATILPAKNIRIPGTKWQFSLNPGPFNIKEHVIISTFASSGVGSTSAIDIMATFKAFFKTTIHPLASFLLILTTNIFGLGFIGFFMKLLVDSPHMWWPESLPSVAFFRAIWGQLTKTFQNGNGIDVHVKMMKKYDTIPLWWFIVLLISMTGLTILTCEGFGNQLQLPYWGVLLQCVLVLILIPSFGVLRATISQQPPLGAFTQMIIGYVYPGKPLANATFEAYAMMNVDYALSALSDFKLGLYMKIPPKAMFLSQVIGGVIASACEFATVWLLFSSVENICRPELLPRGSQWTCPYDQVLYNNMMTWGVVGPKRVFYPNGVYSNLFMFFLLGALLPIPVWFLAHTFPEKKWIGLINVSTIFIAGASMLPVSAVNYLSWFAVAFFLKFVVYRKHRRWYSEYGYLLSVAIDTGISLTAFLVTVTLQIHNVNGIDWWGLDVSDHCPLATCPTARGVRAEGCPVF